MKKFQMYNSTLIPFVCITKDEKPYSIAIPLSDIAEVRDYMRGKGATLERHSTDFYLRTKEPYYSIMARIKAAMEGEIVKPFLPHRKEKIKEENKAARENDSSEAWVIRSKNTVYLTSKQLGRYAIEENLFYWLASISLFVNTETQAKIFKSKPKAEAYLKRYKAKLPKMDYIIQDLNEVQGELNV